MHTVFFRTLIFLFTFLISVPSFANHHVQLAVGGDALQKKLCFAEYISNQNWLVLSHQSVAIEKLTGYKVTLLNITKQESSPSYIKQTSTWRSCSKFILEIQETTKDKITIHFRGTWDYVRTLVTTSTKISFRFVHRFCIPECWYDRGSSGRDRREILERINKFWRTVSIGDLVIPIAASSLNHADLK